MVIILTLILISSSSLFVSAEESNTVQNPTGEIVDIMAIESNCIANESCQPWRPNNLIEYFGADWCEPCEEVEHIIEQIDNESNLVIQHHPSVFDQTYLNHSKFRFDLEYRLIFIPSIVINGDWLLTGSTQALELNDAISSANKSFSGINYLEFDNYTLNWSTNSGLDLKIWKTEEVRHELENRTLPFLATEVLTLDSNQTEVNLSMWLENWTGRLIFTLEKPGLMPLTSFSENPTGGISLTELDNSNDDSANNENPSKLAMSVFVLLLLSIIPALVMFRTLQKTGFEEDE